MDSIERKREHMSGSGEQASVSLNLGQYQPAVDAALAEIDAPKDHRSASGSATIRVWKPDPAEISNRLGWLHIAEDMLEGNAPSRMPWSKSVRLAGYTQAVLLGMGGSSLAPEVLRKTFGVRPGYLDLAVLDSTDPGAVLGCARELDPAKTLFIVSTKSGGTVETFSFFKFFYNLVAGCWASSRPASISSPSPTQAASWPKLASSSSFRATFLNNPHIGGRYSALSYFGLAPAALLGVDLRTLLDRALSAWPIAAPGLTRQWQPRRPAGRHPGRAGQSRARQMHPGHLAGASAPLAIGWSSCSPKAPAKKARASCRSSASRSASRKFMELTACSSTCAWQMTIPMTAHAGARSWPGSRSCAWR